MIIVTFLIHFDVHYQKDIRLNRFSVIHAKPVSHKSEGLLLPERKKINKNLLQICAFVYYVLHYKISLILLNCYRWFKPKQGSDGLTASGSKTWTRCGGIKICLNIYFFSKFENIYSKSWIEKITLCYVLTSTVVR